jgi:hypothetical protein
MTKLAAAWLCVALVACAMGGKKAAMAPAQTMPEAHTGAPPVAESPHDEIERLSNEIAAQKSSAVPVAPNPMSAGSSETCKSVCDIKDSICKNSGRICELANGMSGDDWAAGKCTDAKQACDDAKKRCTDCNG